MISLLGCSIIPLTKGVGAVNLKEGKWELDSQISVYQDKSGGNLSVPSVRAIYGLRDWVNLGAHTEFQTLTSFARFSLLVPVNDGFYLSGIGGLVLLTGNLSYYAGLVGSYRIKRFEPYLGVFYHLANLDPSRVDISFFNTPPDVSFHFATYVLGAKYWLTQDVGVGGEWAYASNGSGILFPMHHLLSAQASFIF